MKLYEMLIGGILIIVLLIIIPIAVILGISMINYRINGYHTFSSMTEVIGLILNSINPFLPFIFIIFFALSLAYVAYQIID